MKRGNDAAGKTATAARIYAADDKGSGGRGLFGLFRRKREAEPPSTVSDMMDIIRPIAIDHGVSEAYISYDSRRDVATDRPDWIFLSYTMLPGHDISEAKRFEKEIDRLFGDRVCPVLQHPSDFNIAVARKFYVNLFA